MALETKVVVLYDRDYLKKFRVYFGAPGGAPGGRVKFEHNMYAFGGNYAAGRTRISPDYIHITTIAPENHDGSVMGSVLLDGRTSALAGAGPWGYDERYIWLVNANSDWPVDPDPVIAEVLLRYFHSHERLGRNIDNVDESVTRALLPLP
jgi:hypothetical protein